MDLGDFFEFDFPLREPGPRGKKILRILFGLALAALSVAGVKKGLDGGYSSTGWMFNASVTFVFVSLILFGVLNVAFGLKSHWPAWLVPISLALVFAVRIVFGA